MTQAAVRPDVAGEVPVHPPADVPARAVPVAGDLRDRSARRARTSAPGRRHRRGPWLVALVGYASLVGVVVGWPSPVDAGAQGELSAVLAALHARGVPVWLDYGVVESAANVAMFVPLGVIVAQLCRRWWWALLVPAALSGAAELGQHALRPERYATWADVAANTAGAALGVALALVARVVLTARRAAGAQ